MKTQITNPKLKRHYDIILCTGYCDLQTLLSYEDAKHYNAGMYGWNFDVYTFFVETAKGIKSVAISTGYRNTQGKTIDYDLTKEYNQKANAIIKNSGFSSTIDKQLKALINELILKAIE